MAGAQVADVLRTWTAGNEVRLRDEGIFISLVLPEEPSAVAVAIMYAETQPHDRSTDGVGAQRADLMGQFAVAAGGLCVVELLDTDSGQTVYKDTAMAGDETELTACLTELLGRLRT